ncbi:MAG: universal stress protein [Actinomycetota bacterium]|nr:universal stress protein [Actinomycetota bacterium]
MYTQIVVGTDGSASANIAVDAAVELARFSGATLHVVHAHKILTASHLAMGAEGGVMPIDLRETNDAAQAEAQRVCDDVVKRADAVGVNAKAHCVGGDAADALIRVAGEANADLIVVGNRGMTGKKRFVLGSVPNKVAHHCTASVLIVDTSGARS